MTLLSMLGGCQPKWWYCNCHRGHLRDRIGFLLMVFDDPLIVFWRLLTIFYGCFDVFFAGFWSLLAGFWWFLYQISRCVFRFFPFRPLPPVTPVTPRARPNCAVFWDLENFGDFRGYYGNSDGIWGNFSKTSGIIGNYWIVESWRMIAKLV